MFVALGLHQALRSHFAQHLAKHRIVVDPGLHDRAQMIRHRVIGLIAVTLHTGESLVIQIATRSEKVAELEWLGK